MCKAMSRAENGTQVIYFHETKDIQRAWKKIQDHLQKKYVQKCMAFHGDAHILEQSKWGSSSTKNISNFLHKQIKSVICLSINI